MAASSAKVKGELNRLDRGGVPQNFDPRNIQVVSLDNPRAFMHIGFLSERECDLLVVRVFPHFDFVERAEVHVQFM